MSAVVGIIIDSDDWVCMRSAELRSKGESCEIVVLVKDGLVYDCFIRLSNGEIERPKKPRVLPGGWEAYCAAPTKETE